MHKVMKSVVMNRVPLMQVEQEVVKELLVELERLEELQLGEDFFDKWLESLGLEGEEVGVWGVDVEGFELLGDVGADQLVQACAGGLVLLAFGEVGLLLFGHCGAVLAFQLIVFNKQVQPAVLRDHSGVLSFYCFDQ